MVDTITHVILPMTYMYMYMYLVRSTKQTDIPHSRYFSGEGYNFREH